MPVLNPAPYEAAMRPLCRLLVVSFLSVAVVGYVAFSIIEHEGAIGFLVAGILPAITFSVLCVLERIACLQPRWPEPIKAKFATTAANPVANSAVAYLTMLMVVLVSTAVDIIVTMLLTEYLDLPTAFDATDAPSPVIVIIALPIAYVTTALTHYAMHKHACLFKSIHAMHHTSKKFDATLAFWFHPLELVLDVLRVKVVLMLLIKMRPGDLVWVTAILASQSNFEHSNIRTPWLLGFFISRPEMHIIHHEEPWPRPEGWKRRNFSQLPLIDMLLGTFYNPKVDPREDAALRVGFADNLDDLNTPKGVLKQLCMHDMRAAQANLTVPIPAAGTTDCAEP